MGKYVLVYRGGAMPETDEEREAEMARWGAWYGAMGDAVVDGGNPFAGSASIAADGAVSQPGASGLTGYTIVSSDDLDGAVAIGKGCPILGSGGSVEVYETFDVM